MSKKFESSIVEADNQRYADLPAARFLSSFSHLTANNDKSQHIIAKIISQDSVAAFDLSGERAIDDYFPGHSIHNLAVSASTEETLLSTIGDDFRIRTARIENFKIQS